jgi:hypothetical protein
MRALISGIIFCITTAGCVVSYAHALSWPARPTRWLVPFSPGS